ncbi:deoxyhypusine hydroxylase [Tulasnella sp. 427]|nr:deoxyhypusine hydroxylase [Tulasnella sp. 427]
MVSQLNVTNETLLDLQSRLLNSSGTVPLHDRFRALFTLKAVGDERAIEVISKGVLQRNFSLPAHELAYVLGQINNPAAIPTLNAVLENKKEDPMVRHEAAEALGAISQARSLPILREYLNDPERAVRETCEIAIAKIEWDSTPEGQAERVKREAEKKEAEENGTIRQFTSIDPAPPSAAKSVSSGLLRGITSHQQTSSVAQLRAQLLDTALPLFQRYRAMFALRNIGSSEAIDALADGFGDDSALFKHEIAFVFGQLSHPHSIPSLIKVLQDSNEAEMVRHEAAEALGGIAEAEDGQGNNVYIDGKKVDVVQVLKEWMTRPDAPLVVKQSCQVAIDMWEYENSNQFQYANALQAEPKTTAAA